MAASGKRTAAGCQTAEWLQASDARQRNGQQDLVWFMSPIAYGKSLRQFDWRRLF